MRSRFNPRCKSKEGAIVTGGGLCCGLSRASRAVSHAANPAAPRDISPRASAYSRKLIAPASGTRALRMGVCNLSGLGVLATENDLVPFVCVSERCLHFSCATCFVYAFFETLLNLVEQSCLHLAQSISFVKCACIISRIITFNARLLENCVPASFLEECVDVL